MDNKTIAEIIVDFVVRNSENQKYDDFFAYNDLGIPLAVALNAGLCSLNEVGSEVIKETYKMLCTELGADSEEEFEDLDDLLDNLE